MKGSESGLDIIEKQVSKGDQLFFLRFSMYCFTLTSMS